MESLYILLPLSVLLVLALIGLFGWAVHSGQFDDLEREGWRVLEEDQPPMPRRPELDQDQTRPHDPSQQSRHAL
ncbi:MAG TPA: cbb3-type cytochrome oxidase assembly protein CcoS [Rhizobacter sp.]|nr:cbb3-type cytochrome oxidase assembly protein CcoS [Rhizobacter sp.]